MAPGPRPTFLASALIAAALLAGCGDDDEETTVTETVATAEEGTETGAETTEATGTIETTGTVAGEGNHGPKYFQSPSGNIGCYLDSKGVRCDIRKRDWKPPPGDPVEAKCELDYGQGIALSASHASFVCAGDTTLGGPNTLQYGQSSRRGPFRCESSEAEMLCFHTGNGRGFSLSREGYRIF